MAIRRRSGAVGVLAALLGLEALALAVLTVLLVVDTAVSGGNSLVSGIALSVLVLIATAWLAAMAPGVWRGASWTRGGSIVWHVLLGAVAIGAFQGVFAVPSIGWALLLPALLGLVLVFTPSTVRWLRRDAAG